mmetsp:Transcript_15897/g.20057  ORF Transcript_15897/g.20057 Transcript_15897/m.20057 type:complete len:127 (+) Transcript_15897:76-456(+)
MISYNDEDKAWAQRVQKEIWTKDELKDFGIGCNADNLRKQFNLAKPELQDEMEVTLRSKLDYLKQQRRIMAVKQGKGDELSEHSNSIWSRVPPSPRACNEELIWKSNLHRKNQHVRGENSAVGRLG